MIKDIFSQRKEFPNFCLVKNIFLSESQFLIKNEKIKEILKLIYIRKFDKIYDILMTSYDIEEDINDKLAQIIFELDYLYLISSLKYVHECLTENSEFVRNLTFHTNNLFFQKKKKFQRFFSINSDIMKEYSIESEKTNIEEKIVETFEDLINYLKKNNIIGNGNTHTDQTIHSIFIKFFKKFRFDGLNVVNSNIFTEILDRSIIQIHNPFSEFSNRSKEESRLDIIKNRLEETLKSREILSNFSIDNEINNTLISKHISKAQSSFNTSISHFNHSNYFLNNNNYNDVDPDLNTFQLKIKIFNVLKTFLRKRKEKIQFKKKIVEKEKMANFFYVNLTKSRCFYILHKRIRQKGVFRIICEKNEDFTYFHQKQLFMKFLINCYHKKKLLKAYTMLQNKRTRMKVFNALTKKINYYIQQGQLFFTQMINNQFSVKFLEELIRVTEKLVSQFQIIIIKKKRLKTRMNQLHSKLNFYKKKELFRILKENYISEKYIELNIEKNRFDFSNKIRMREYSVFFSFFNKIKSIIEFRKNLFFIRFYYKKFVEKKTKKHIETEKYRFYLFLFKKICLTNKTKLNKNDIENRRIHMIQTVFRNKIISGVLGYFTKIIRIKKNQKQTLYIKTIKYKKKFIRVLKRLNIVTMIQQILNYKYCLLMKKQLLKKFFEVSVVRHKFNELFKKFFLKMFITNLKCGKKVINNISKDIKVEKFSDIEEEFTTQNLLEKKYFTSLFLKKSKSIMENRIFFKTKLEDCKKLFLNIKIYKFIFNVRDRTKSKIDYVGKEKELKRLIFIKLIKKKIQIRKEESKTSDLNKDRIKLFTIKRVFKKMIFITKSRLLKNLNKRCLDKFYLKYLIKRLISISKFTSKLGQVDSQITDLYSLKLVKHSILALKKNYIGKIKYQMIMDKYNTLISLKYTKKLIEKYIEKQNK